MDEFGSQVDFDSYRNERPIITKKDLKWQKKSTAL